MEMSGLWSESHVAQQSRRDKLRVQQTLNPSHHLDNLPNHSVKLPLHPGLNPDIVQVRNVRHANLLYDPTMFSSEMLNFSINANELSTQASGEIENFGNWRSLNPPRSVDWVTSYTSGSVGTGSNNENHMFVREVNDNVSPSTPHLKASTTYNGFQDVQSSLANPSADQISNHHITQNHPGEVMHFSSPPNYSNTLQYVVTSASTGSQDQLEMAALVHQRTVENEIVLLPSYVNQSNTRRFGNVSNSWMDRQPVESRHNWSSGDHGLGVSTAKTAGKELRTGMSGDSNQQGLSLSLSSIPLSAKLPLAQFGSQELQASTDADQAFKDRQNSKTGKSSAGYLSSIAKPSIISKACGKSLQDIVGTSSTAYRSTGPLGPFTGYATILKCSKFLKPAQQLLDEFCRVGDSKLMRTCEASERMSGEVSADDSVDAVNAIETELVTKGNNSGASSSTFYGSNEISSDGGAASISSESFRPEYQQKKAKLLYMQEEVCKRYEQYHQQMQMVVSSFESVAGLSSATPYISMALNAVSRHFKCLTSSIKDQLKLLRKALGEEYLSSAITTGTTAPSTKGDNNVAKLKYMGLGFQKHNKSGGGAHLGFSESQQHVWRAQRGLPERSVAILRAWLFDHFLHPYPTDTDKHMLATQTGLSRNQVSNWFINARVRVWKPMVEEIHMLETRGGSLEAGQDLSKKDGNSATYQATSSRAHNDHQLDIHMMLDRQLECSGDAEHQSQEMKRSRLEYEVVPSSLDGALMGFVPYQRSGLEVGGLGAVSLTLALRHGVESAQQQQQQLLQQQEDQLRRQMIHDFVG